MKVVASNWHTERTRSLFLHQIGELTTYWYGDVLLGVRTSDGCFKNALEDFWGFEKSLIKRKQALIGMNSWGDGVDADKLREIAGTAAIREFGTFARARMAGET